MRATPSGSAARPARTSARLWVRDTGPGVPPGDRLRIFERFESGVRASEGRSTGLGLAIVSAIARAHGGTGPRRLGRPRWWLALHPRGSTTNPDPDHDGSWPDQEDYDSVTTIFERVNAGAGRS